jgi:hypothetical protein
MLLLISIEIFLSAWQIDRLAQEAVIMRETLIYLDKSQA